MRGKLRVIKVYSSGSAEQYHIIVGEDKNFYRVSPGWNSKERAVSEYKWRKRYGFSNDCYSVAKEDVIEESEGF